MYNTENQNLPTNIIHHWFPQMYVDWNINNALRLSLGHLEVSCTLPKQSPAPDLVTDVHIKSVMFEGSFLSVSVDWKKPNVSNGVLTMYQVCFSSNKDTSSPPSFCTDVNVRRKVSSFFLFCLIDCSHITSKKY